jgi:starch phosphorylase
MKMTKFPTALLNADASAVSAPSAAPAVSASSALSVSSASLASFASSAALTTPRVAYFCMEYGLHPELHLYAGGLGILAGDYLKAAHDLDLPVVGIGLLWRQGYTRQVLDAQGVPYDTYPIYNYDFLKDTGVKVSVEIRGRAVTCKVWLVDKYGNAPLYLLDTNLPENDDRWITGQLYGWFGEERVAQEMVLGIGGVRALRALGIPVDIYHFNEGHAVLAALELIKEKMQAGSDYNQALCTTRREIVFTTHTPVKEGNESHPLSLLEYMGAFNGLAREQMIALGGDPFNMTVAGLRLARVANGVSALHGQTAQHMWKDVTNAAPIIAITNGIHTGTWQDARIRNAYETSADLWLPHMEAKKELLAAVLARTGAQLNPDNLLIGFARRAVPYKRSDLIFSNPEVIEPYLRDGRIQIIFSGKAHPLDDQGKAIVARLVSFSKAYPNSVVFLENYDMEIGRLLTRGTDVWLNNPKRPLEASGTSGMKAAMNGILNVSVLDGWWPEGCIHGVNGWEFGHGYEGPLADEIDLAGLYQVMLDQVAPTFYENRPQWVRMMRAAIDMSVERFSASRMLQEYYSRMYVDMVKRQERVQ